MLNICCVICSEIFEPTEEVYVTRCGHLFHRTCINDWLQRSHTCPQCRKRCTLLDVHRIYFNLETNETSINNIIDNVTVNELLDSANIQVKESEKNLSKADEEIRLLTQTQQEYIEKINVLEQKLEDSRGSVLSYKEQVIQLNRRIECLETNNSSLEIAFKRLTISNNDIASSVKFNLTPTPAKSNTTATTSTSAVRSHFNPIASPFFGAPQKAGEPKPASHINKAPKGFDFGFSAPNKLGNTSTFETNKSPEMIIFGDSTNTSASSSTASTSSFPSSAFFFEKAGSRTPVFSTALKAEETKQAITSIPSTSTAAVPSHFNPIPSPAFGVSQKAEESKPVSDIKKANATGFMLRSSAPNSLGNTSSTITSRSSTTVSTSSSPSSASFFENPASRTPVFSTTPFDFSFGNKHGIGAATAPSSVFGSATSSSTNAVVSKSAAPVFRSTATTTAWAAAPTFGNSPSFSSSFGSSIIDRTSLTKKAFNGGFSFESFNNNKPGTDSVSKFSTSSTPRFNFTRSSDGINSTKLFQFNAAAETTNEFRPMLRPKSYAQASGCSVRKPRSRSSDGINSTKLFQFNAAAETTDKAVQC